MAHQQTVQYMRPYTIDELVKLQGDLQQLFANEPTFVMVTVLMQELRRRLSADAEDMEERPDVRVDPAPEAIANLVAALERVIPTFIQLSVSGLSNEETVS